MPARSSGRDVFERWSSRRWIAQRIVAKESGLEIDRSMTDDVDPFSQQARG